MWGLGFGFEFTGLPMALAWSARGIRLRDFLQKVPAPGPNTQGSGGGQKGLANKRPNPRDG